MSTPTERSVPHAKPGAFASPTQSLHIVTLPVYNALPALARDDMRRLRFSVGDIKSHFPGWTDEHRLDDFVVLYQLGEWEPDMPVAIVLVDTRTRSWIYQNPANSGTPEMHADYVLALIDLVSYAG